MQSFPPFMFPMFPQQQQQERQSGLLDLGVPVRVSVAMQLLAALTEKESERPGDFNPFGGSVSSVSGVKLTIEEISARCTALAVIEKYLAGSLPPDQYEKMRLNHASKINRKRGKPDMEPVQVLRCPGCGGQGQSDCPICKGDAMVIVVRKSKGDSFE